MKLKELKLTLVSSKKTLAIFNEDTKNIEILAMNATEEQVATVENHFDFSTISDSEYLYEFLKKGNAVYQKEITENGDSDWQEC